jgi:hypothetical protein
VDRFDSIRAFAKVVESGSFAGAAARLGISASITCQTRRGWVGRLFAMRAFNASGATFLVSPPLPICPGWTLE